MPGQFAEPSQVLATSPEPEPPASVAGVQLQAEEGFDDAEVDPAGQLAEDTSSLAERGVRREAERFRPSRTKRPVDLEDKRVVGLLPIAHAGETSTAGGTHRAWGDGGKQPQVRR